MSKISSIQAYLGGEKNTFSKQDIQKAIDVITEEIKYIKMTEPQATVELDNLEFTIVSLEGYRDRDSIDIMLREQENLAVKMKFS